MKIIGGSLLTGFSLLAEVLNEWSSHFFYAVFQIAQGVMLEGAGRFRTPPQYTNSGISMTDIFGFGVDIFIVTRILIWVFMVTGVLLVVWGLREEKVSGIQRGDRENANRD
jgi:hypothetical protein